MRELNAAIFIINKRCVLFQIYSLVSSNAILCQILDGNKQKRLLRVTKNVRDLFIYIYKWNNNVQNEILFQTE